MKAEEINALKEEIEAVNKKLAELTEEELEQVSGGGSTVGICPRCHKYVTIYTSGNTLTCSSCGHSWSSGY